MIEDILDIDTGNGAMETFICRPDRGQHPPVLFLMDAPGIRAELYDMARRLASVGYAVLMPNLYYRAGRDTKYGPDVLDKGSAEQQRMRAVRTKMTIPPVMNDVAALIAYTDGHNDIKNGPVGVHGYCMSGPLCLGSGGALSGPHCGGSIDLRYLAGQRCRGEPAPQSRQSERRTLHLVCRV